MDSIEKITWWGVFDDLTQKEYPSLEESMEDSPWVIVKDIKGYWLNTSSVTGNVHKNPEFVAELYKSTGEQIIELIIGKWKIKKMSIDQFDYNRTRVSFVIVHPDKREERKVFGYNSNGVLNSIRFLKIMHYEHENRLLQEKIDKLVKENDAHKTEAESKGVD